MSEQRKPCFSELGARATHTSLNFIQKRVLWGSGSNFESCEAIWGHGEGEMEEGDNFVGQKLTRMFTPYFD